MWSETKSSAYPAQQQAEQQLRRTHDADGFARSPARSFSSASLSRPHPPCHLLSQRNLDQHGGGARPRHRRAEWIGVVRWAERESPSRAMARARPAAMLVYGRRVRVSAVRVEARLQLCETIPMKRRAATWPNYPAAIRRRTLALGTAARVAHPNRRGGGVEKRIALVLIYGVSLAVGVHGPPDTEQIREFGRQGSWAVPVLVLALTAVAASWVARRAGGSILAQGVLLGATAAAVGLIASSHSSTAARRCGSGWRSRSRSARAGYVGRRRKRRRPGRRRSIGPAAPSVRRRIPARSWPPSASAWPINASSGSRGQTRRA